MKLCLSLIHGWGLVISSWWDFLQWNGNWNCGKIGRTGRVSPRHTPPSTKVYWSSLISFTELRVNVSLYVRLNLLAEERVTVTNLYNLYVVIGCFFYIFIIYTRKYVFITEYQRENGSWRLIALQSNGKLPSNEWYRTSTVLLYHFNKKNAYLDLNTFNKILILTIRKRQNFTQITYLTTRYTFYLNLPNRNTNI